MTKSISLFGLFLCFATVALAAPADVLFNGKNLDAFDFKEGAWVIEDGVMTCKMEETKDKKGNVRVRGMGYIWTEKDYSDFSLTLSYKLSEAANSGVFFRSDPGKTELSGFEIHLIDDEGFKKNRGTKPVTRKLHGMVY